MFYNLLENYEKQFLNESTSSVKKDLMLALMRRAQQLENEDERSIKAYEIAFQDVIEKLFPEKSWWEVIDLNIFSDLMNNKMPQLTIRHIVDNIKPEFLGDTNEDYIPGFGEMPGYHMEDGVLTPDEFIDGDDDEEELLTEDGERIHFKKHGFIRTPEKDFSDDGSRFYVYEYNGIPISYTKWNDEYFISARPDYNSELNWNEYRELPGYDKFDDLNGVFKVTDDDLEELKKNIDIFQKAYKDKVNSVEPVSDEDITAVYNDIRDFKKNELKEITDIIKNLNLLNLSDYELRQVKDYYKSLKNAVNRWEITADDLSKISQPQRRRIKEPGYIEQEKRASFYYNELKDILSKASKWEENLQENCNSYSYKDCVIINDSKANCWRIKDSKGNWVGNCFSTDKEAEEFIDSKNESLNEEIIHNDNGNDYEVLTRNKVGDALLKATSPKFTQYVVAWNCPVGSTSWGQGHYFIDADAAWDFWNENYANLTEALAEDIVKISSGKWVNKGKEGTHGTFRTKKAADAQRKAMFAQGYKAEAWEPTFDPDEWEEEDIEKWKAIDWSKAEHGEYEDATDEITATVYKYSTDEPPETKKVVMHKFFRQNPIYPPYYKATEEPFDGTVGAMADGRMHGKYDIHDRYETQELYDMLSESKKIRKDLFAAGYRK